MPFFDRHWQLRRIGAVLAALAAILFPVRYLQIALTWDARRGWDMTPDVIFAVGAALALALTAVLLARSVAPARERQEYRRAVIEGRETPPKEKPEYAPPGEPPLVVVLRISVWDRVFGCFFALVTLVSAMLVPLVTVWTVEILLGVSAAQIGITDGRAFIFFIVALVMPVSVWGFGTMVRNAVGRSPRYVADADRLTYTPQWGKACSILWSHARLLEQTTYWDWEARGRETRNQLYGDGSVIVIDPNAGRYRDRSRLLDLIQRRTGLDVIELGESRLRGPVGVKLARLLRRTR